MAPGGHVFEGSKFVLAIFVGHPVTIFLKIILNSY